MLIYLFRHGIAIDRMAPNCPADPDRFLTEKGIRRTETAVQGMAKLGVVVDLVLSSPFVRARQTADIAVRVLGLPCKVHETDNLQWDANPDGLRQELAGLHDAEAVLCAGHAPHLDVFIGHMLGTPPVTELKKAGLAVLDSSFTEPGDAHLLAIYPPRALRQLAAAT